MPQLAKESLHWVSGELAGTLKEARVALEQYADDTGNRDLLRDCARALHSAHGALRMVEVHGAALLANEMVSVCKSLYKQSSRSESEALDALSRAVVQMPAYLDRVLAGGRDIPLVLLPLLNDLRAVRGSALLSESTLFVLNIAPGHDEHAVEPSPSGEDILFVGRRLRPRYQAGLLGWLRGEQVDSNLATMGVVAKNLSQAATTGAFYQLWWVAGAVIEALRDEGLPPSAAVKRLLGKADRQIKRMLDEGEAVFSSVPPTDLLNNLLYYVARATSAGELVQAVKASFSLGDLFPGADAVHEEHAALSAPSSSLMSTVGEAIKGDLSSVKDALDLFVRSGMHDAQSLADQLDQLRKVANTLGLLGLGELQAFVDEQRSSLAAFVEDGSASPDDSALLTMAQALLSVEDRLDAQLLDAINPTTATEQGDAAENNQDFQQVSSAVIRECIVNLARVKDAITQFIAQPDVPRALEPVPRLLQGINAGMILLERPRVVGILERIGDFIEQRVGGGDGPPLSHMLDRLADSIVSVEYYLETLQNGRSDPWYMLDNAESCLDALGAPARRPEPEHKPVTADSSVSAPDTGASHPDTIESATPEQAVEPESTSAEPAPGDPLTPALPERPEFAAPPAADLPPTLASAASGSVRDAVDPDLLELFIEEAKEELAAIRENQPPFAANPNDRNRLLSLRRSFHTLKGSGRMVGAEAIGEFAWVVENLLNRIVDGTRPAGPGMLSVLQSSIAALDELIENLEVGAPFKTDVAAIMAAAQALIDGEPVPDVDTPDDASDNAGDVSDRAPLDVADDNAHLDFDKAAFAEAGDHPAPAPPAEAQPEAVEQHAMDPVLYEIFSKETRDHLQVLRDFVAECMARPEPHPLTEQVHRACHTLKGSANMAAAETAVSIAAPMNKFVRKAFEADVDLFDEDVALIGRAIAAVEDVVARINSEHPVTDDHADIAARFEALEQALEAAEAARSAQSVTGTDAEGEASPPAPMQDSAGGDAGDKPADLIDAANELSDATADSQADSDTETDSIAQPDDSVPASAQADSTQPVDSVAEALPEDFDHDIAAIFYEEAVELLDDSDLALQGLAKTPGNVSLLAELQRYLHSLKGGARMSGLVAMGDLSHELESLLIAVDDGRCAADNHTLDILQRSLDRLHGMCEALSAGRTSAPATDLVDEVRALSSGAAAPLSDEVAATDTQVPEIAADSVLENEVASAQTRAAEAPGDEEQADHEYLAAEQTDAEQTDAEQTDDEQIDDEQVDAEQTDDEQVDDERLADKATADEQFFDAAFEAADEPEPVDEASDVPSGELADVPPQRGVVEPLNLHFGSNADADALADDAARNITAASAPADEAAEGDMEDAAATDEAPLASDAAATQPEPLMPVVQRERRVAADRGDVARVDAELLDELLNNAGEVSIYHSRLEQQVNSIAFNLAELSQTVSRLRDQFRSLEAETEAEIIHRHEADVQRREDFDPLEMDRYSTIQQLSRALAESCSDLSSLQGLLEDLTQETETLLVQQARVTTELQDGLMRTRMVPFRQYLPRFSRLVRQTARECGKQVELVAEGAGDLDRQVLERMLPSFEHMLRNAVVHGAETPAQRRAAGKPATATVIITLRREGSEMVIELADDGAGLNADKILSSARKRGLIDAAVTLGDLDAIQLILEPGVSTASKLTQSAGRGVGLDVVATEVKQLGGRLGIDSEAGKGARFTVRLPLTLAISQALLVRTAEEQYAIPMPTVEGIVRLPKAELLAYLESEEPGFEYGGQRYRFEQLGLMLGGRPANLAEGGASVPVVLVRAGEHSSALITDEIVGSREVVVKNVGPQIASIRGIAGATILGDGSIVMILDVHSLVRAGVRQGGRQVVAEARVDERPLILVVDDSITVRRVTERLLERNDMRVVTARDGVDAVAILQDLDPHLILLDIEMPRMDGYEVASHVRNSERHRDVPIVMVTSRVGDKHRARAFELGVNDYLGKPYQESQLLGAIRPLLESYSTVRLSGT